MTTPSAASADVIDAAVPLASDDRLHGMRRQRQKIVDATQGSHDEMFSAAVQGVSVVERLRVALHADHKARPSALNCLDHAVGRAASHAQPGRDITQRLVMKGVGRQRMGAKPRG